MQYQSIHVGDCIFPLEFTITPRVYRTVVCLALMNQASIMKYQKEISAFVYFK